jgi:hypothetical protein
MRHISLRAVAHFSCRNPRCLPCVLLLVLSLLCLRPSKAQAKTQSGKFADFLVLDPTRFGVVFDPRATLVLVASEPDLERVYAGGHLHVERGTLLHQDLRHIEAEVNRRASPWNPSSQFRERQPKPTQSPPSSHRFAESMPPR